MSSVPRRREPARRRAVLTAAPAIRDGSVVFGPASPAAPLGEPLATPPPPAATWVPDDPAILEGILRGLDALVIVTDGHGLVTHFNRRSEEITGYREAEVLGRPVSHLVAPGQVSDVERLVERLASDGGSIATSQVLVA